MQTFGIDKIHFYVPEFYFELSQLAEKQGLPKDYYSQHIVIADRFLITNRVYVEMLALSYCVQRRHP